MHVYFMTNGLVLINCRYNKKMNDCKIHSPFFLGMIWLAHTYAQYGHNDTAVLDFRWSFLQVDSIKKVRCALQIKAVTSQIPFCIADNGIWRGRSDRFNIGLICNENV